MIWRRKHLVTDPNARDRFDALAAAARERFSLRTDGKPTAIVRIGHCSLAAGVAELERALSTDVGDDGVVITAGCDGACSRAPSGATLHPPAGSSPLLDLNPDSIDAVSHPVFYDGAACVPVGPEGLEQEYVTSRSPENQRRVSLAGCGYLDAESIDHYLATGGYSAWALALQIGPEDVIQTIKDSRLRGRGGAYFPAGVKWESARGFDAPQRYMVVNCEEGEPGLFKDRHLMEGVPHRVIEGACIAAYAANASQVIFYINAEANLSAERMDRALGQARELGLLGPNVLGSNFSVEAEIRRGAGGYVCGEETTLLNTLEGYRREPRTRPPYPVEAGLWSRPTVINNAETLASVPYILNEGAEKFAEIGDGQDTGTKIINLSGAVRYPGLIEVPFGTTLREIIYDIGGGPPDGRSLKMIGVGGPSSGVLPPSMLDTPIAPGFLHESGVMLGAGAIIVVDDSMDVLSVIRNLAQYNANESCGKCTPCREGTPRMVEMIDALAAGRASTSVLDDLSGLAQLVNTTSLCGLGQAAGNPILSGLHFFRDEIETLSGVSQ